jgi:hypothetical protein
MMSEKSGYYDVGGLSTLDILQAKLSEDEYRGFLLGNVFKYLSRHKHKNGVEDIQKAFVYLDLYEKEYRRKIGLGECVD